MCGGVSNVCILRLLCVIGCDFWIVLSSKGGLFGIVVRCICMCVLFLLIGYGVRVTFRIAGFRYVFYITIK